MRTAVAVALVFYTFAAAPAYAQDAKAEYSADEFVRAILSGPQPCPKGQSIESCEANPKTRRFSLATGAGASAARASQAPARKPTLLTKIFASKPKLSAADVLVTFASGSADITEQGQANLRSIAAGLNKPALAALSFEVAGFTDVTGSARFNQGLSQRRAEAVKAYLVSLEVSPTRLTTVGYGSDHLIDPGEPTSEANRRVELHRIN
jgi:OmpA-OmpF porin, OOP family